MTDDDYHDTVWETLTEEFWNLTKGEIKFLDAMFLRASYTDAERMKINQIYSRRKDK